MPSALPISKARETSVPKVVLSLQEIFSSYGIRWPRLLKDILQDMQKKPSCRRRLYTEEALQTLPENFLKSGFDSHDCTQTRCRKCGGHFPWSEIADHTCMEVKQCSHCNRTFPVSEWEGHHCPSRRCAKCGWIFRDRTEITMNASGRDILLVLHTGSSKRWRHIG